jgi:hypothetical protein
MKKEVVRYPNIGCCFEYFSGDVRSSSQCFWYSKCYKFTLYTRVSQMKTLNFTYFLSRNLLNTKGTQWLHFSVWSPLRSIQVFQRFGSACIPLEKILLAESATTRAPPAAGQGESVTELMPFMNFLVHSCTCCSDRHASPYSTFICRWISMGFTPSLLKKWMGERWCMLQAGPPSLHYYCAVVSHSCIVLPPVGHSSYHEYHCCQLTRQLSCVSNFYHTFKVFIWLSLVIK